ncbi:MAG: cytochrome c3 family protein [Coriobacteriia bacterium]|nr:cytochrome c3 family protein [Coriobacteriia bacterium]
MPYERGPHEHGYEHSAPRPRRRETARTDKRRSKARKRTAPPAGSPRVAAALRTPGPRRRRSPVLLIAVPLLALTALLAVTFVATSSEGFCTRSCHSVHGDDVAAFAQSTHQRTSCVTCHIDAGAGLFGSAAYRLGKLGDFGSTLFGKVEQPVNAMSLTALSMSSAQCTQCHVMEQRRVTPSAGIVIDHAAHEEAGIGCTACHNRVAHPEAAITLEIEGNAPKQDFMAMTACYRCHSLGEAWASEYRAPGECVTCHTSGFDLVPPSHDAEGWYTPRGESKGHTVAFMAEEASAQPAQAAWDAAAGGGGKPRTLVDVPPVAIVNECDTCHLAGFCTDCHGTPIPHPDGFAAAHSQEFTAKDAAGCAKCHNKTGAEANDNYTCTLCHHPDYDPADGTWRRRHDDVIDGGVNPLESCYACHAETFCSSCHVRGKPSTPY